STTSAGRLSTPSAAGAGSPPSPRPAVPARTRPAPRPSTTGSPSTSPAPGRSAWASTSVTGSTTGWLGFPCGLDSLFVCALRSLSILSQITRPGDFAMTSALIACACLVAAAPPAESESPPDRAAYEAATTQAGRSSEAHVKLALWCEAHGLGAERV